MRALCCVLVIAVLAGCSTEPAAPPVVSGSSTTTTAYPTYPTSPPMTPEEVAQALDRAHPIRADLAPLGYALDAPLKMTRGAHWPNSTCGGDLISNRDISQWAQADWTGDDGRLRTSVVHYFGPRYSPLAEQIRKLIACSEYDQSDGRHMVVTGEFDLPPVNGMDNQIAYCEDAADFAWCSIVLAYGPFASYAHVQAPDRTSGMAKLTELAPVLGTALLTA